MPPPMISIFLGMARSCSAPVESTMRSSSGRNGSFTDWLPAAMMACLKRMVCFLPSPSVTVRWCGSANSPVPVATRTLHARAMPARPPVSLATTPSL